MPESLMVDVPSKLFSWKKQYQWVIDRFEYEFGKENILYQSRSFDMEFAIGATNGKQGSEHRRHATCLESLECKMQDGELSCQLHAQSYDESGQPLPSQHIKHERWSLNAQPNKEELLENIIKSFRRALFDASDHT